MTAIDRSNTTAVAASTSRPAFSPLSRTVLGFAILACIGVIVLMAGIAYRSHDEQVDAAYRDSRGRAAALAEHARNIISETDLLLRYTAHEVGQTWVEAAAVDRTQAQDVLARHLGSVRQVRGLTLADAGGHVLAAVRTDGSALWSVEPGDLSGPAFDRESSSLLLGRPMVDRLTGEWAVSIGRQVGDGTDLVVAATVELETLRACCDAAARGPVLGSLIVSDTGRVFASNADLTRRLPVRIGEVFAPLAPRDWPPSSATSLDLTVGNGARVLGSLVPAGDLPLSGVVLIAYDEVRAAWLKSATLLLAIGALFAIGTAIFVRLEWVQSRRLHSSLQEMTEIATTDKVTGLANRGTFSMRLTDAIAQANRSQQPTGVLIMDLDRFNEINDTFGHGFGDKLLRQFADRLRDRMRKTDTVARIGGDEFAVIASGMKRAEDAAGLAASIQSDLSVPFFVEGRPINTTVSIGVVVCPNDGMDTDLLLQRADSALYQAKELGVGNIHLFDGERDRIARDRRRIEIKMRDGLRHGEFSLHYQPKFCGRTRRLVGVEALARWTDADGAIVSPGVFIPIAESSGFILELGSWALHTASAQQVAWRLAGLDAPSVAVNISPRQFRHGDISGLVRRVISETGINPHALEVEITESMLMQDVNRAELQLQRLAELGVSVAIDDFGTGYSSLAYLKRFPVTSLKIDRSFVKDILHDADDLAIVQAIVTMGKSLGLTIVAEGVETEEQFQLLSNLDCDVIQGFLLGRPMPADVVESELLQPARPAGPVLATDRTRPAFGSGRNRLTRGR